MKARQPQVVKAKPKGRGITKNTIYGKSKAGSRASKNPRNPKGKKLQGKMKKQFDDIPDSMSTFSKITGRRRKFMPKNEPEPELTEKPTNIYMDGHSAVVQERKLGNGPQREVTDKPNNIRAPINPGFGNYK